jgi:hypothetical protein
VLVAGLAATGCGSGDDDEAAPAETRPTTTTTEATTTTTEVEQADAATVELARAGTLQEGDYGDGWQVHSPARTIDVDDRSCTYRPDGPEAGLLHGAIQDGPTMRLGQSNAYAGSRTFAFPSDEAAVEWLAVVDSDEWAECQRAQLADFQASEGFDVEVQVATREAPELGQQGFESFASFSVADREGNVGAYTEYSFYRLGPVVIRLGLDLGPLAEGEDATMSDDVTAALTAAYERVNAILPPG